VETGVRRQVAADGSGSVIGAERPTRVRNWVIVFAVALAVVTYIDRVSIAYAAPFIQKDLGLDSRQMGMIFSAFAWAYALFEIPGGYLGDRLGPRSVLTRIVLWWSFFTAATGWAWNFASMAVTRFLFGAGEAGCFPNLTKAFTTWLPANERVRAQGIVWLSARWGGAFTPPIIIAVMNVVGWRHCFELFGLLGLVWVAFFFGWYRNNPLDNPRLNAAERELVRTASENAHGHGDVPWGQFLRSRTVWMICAQYFCLSYGWYFYITWFPTYLAQARHMNVQSVAIFGIAPLFMGGLGNPASVWIGNRLTPWIPELARRRRLMASVGFTGAGIFLLLSTLMHDPALAVLTIGMASFSNDLIMPCAWAACMDVGGRHAGTLSGTMNMMGNVGGAIAPTVIGFILYWTHNNWNVTFYLSAAVYLLGVLCWRLLDPVTPLEEQTN
jgi:MFS transporter, ACS family, glucarate transporter